MIQFDVNLEFAIFSKVYEESLDKLTQDLHKRKQNLKWVYERDNLTAEQLKKANAEEEHILLIVEYIRAVEEMLQITRDVLDNRRENQIDWHQEYLKECQKGVEFTEMMMSKLSKIRADEKK